MTFHQYRQTDLNDTTISTALDQRDRVWTLVNTSSAEDVIVLPNGRHIWYVEGRNPQHDEFVGFIAAEVA